MANMEPLVIEVVGKNNTSKALNEASKDINKNKKYVDSLVRSMKQYEAELGMTEKQLKLYRAAQKGATEAQLKEISATYDSIQAKKAQVSATKAANQQFRFMRGGLGQVGHQIQDVVVQAQMGTNAFLILGQQGSQVASLFGPHGALLGALLAVGAAFGTYLTSSKDVEESTVSLTDEVSDLADEYERASDAIRQLKMPDLLKEKERLLEAIEKENSAIAINTGLMDAARLKSGIFSVDLGKFEERIREANIRIEEKNELLDTLNTLISGSTSSTQELISEMEDEIKKLKMSTLEYMLYTAAKQGATDADLARIEALFKEKRAIEQLADAEEARRQQMFEEEEARIKAEKQFREDNLNHMFDAMKREEEAEQERQDKMKQFREDNLSHMLDVMKREDEANEKRQKRVQQLTGLTEMLDGVLMNNAATFASTMESMMADGSAAQKAFYVLSQGIAIADAVMKGYQTAAAIRLAYAELAAATSNPALIEVGEARAAMATAMGFATAGAIAGQTVASFEGGGISFNGVRSGGLDGKGGRMAMVHPNEKITDLEKEGQSQAPVNVSFNISAVDAKGIDELLVQRRSLITNIVNKAINNRGRSSLT